MIDISRELIDKILETVELRELRSLQWGFIDGSLSEEDLKATIHEVLSATKDVNSEDVIEQLLNMCLVFERPQEDGTYRYRSRFAEGVRLLSTLKQLFPKRPWISAPNLVSDYRVDASPRAFPRRDISVVDAINKLAQMPHWSNLHRDLAESILQPSNLRLSAFQVRAMEDVSRFAGLNRGIVISAGTGSGKTLSFYVPSILDIGGLIQNDDYWVKTVALYPRVELLKDQFNQVFQLVVRTNTVLAHYNRRPIRLGTFFSLTPWDCNAQAIEDAKWSTYGEGFICPFLSCPLCGDQMIWHRLDIEHGIEHLICRRSPKCAGDISGEQVVLSRRKLIERPSDIVFTTTEMLNQRISDTSAHKVLGMNNEPNKHPRFALLDEVHTYDGTTGAQTAMVLRRWRHALGMPICFVGLSATLREAPQFLADLVGLNPGSVVEITPQENEFEHYSMNYQLVLRGNPASQTQLLSTSIQASFLLCRLLDPMAFISKLKPSFGRFGNRLFVFTDDLDVTNRLFDNIRDSESYDIFGSIDPNRQPLSALRIGNLPDPITRDNAGQNWRCIEAIGHKLDQRLRISRTSSQDPGVNSNSDIVVATSALELGFNDPTVGAVLQHKSPHQMSSYIQRKGRAGRKQDQRPWIVTVLSDYGRDRLTYQAYDQLFDPVLMPQRLPIRNRYILRMQAVFALIDWLSKTLETSGVRGWMWRVLNGPASGDEWLTDQQKRVGHILDELLKGEGPWQKLLMTHLREALQLDTDENVYSLLWEPPRSLMLEVIPTIARRLSTQWRTHPNGETSSQTDILVSQGRVHPMPEFVPATLFSELNIPDVSIKIPPASIRHEERSEQLGIIQALCQLAPGRVTRRFAFERGSLYHWVPVPLKSGDHFLSISSYAEKNELVAMLPVRIQSEVKTIPCFRPWIIRLNRISDKEVSATSNASFSWRTQVTTTGDPIIVPMSYDPIWGSVILEVAFFLHSFRSPLTIHRFALDAVASLRRAKSNDEIKVNTHFTTNDGDPAAVGFEQEVDGLRIRIRLPNLDTMADLAQKSANVKLWRLSYYRDCILEDNILKNETNWFQRDWLQQIYLSAILAEAQQSKSSIQEACAILHKENPISSLSKVMDIIFRIESSYYEESKKDTDDTQSEIDKPALKENLLELFRKPIVTNRLETIASELWNPNPQMFNTWLHIHVRETIAQAILSACYRISPRYVAPDSLLVDIGDGLPDDSNHVDMVDLYISELSIGGTGIVEAIAQEVIAHPRTFLTALDASLAPGDLEIVASNLNTFVSLTQNDPEIANLIEELRRQKSHETHEKQFRILIATLARKGLNVDHAFSVALHQRLLRQGTSVDSDRLISDLLIFWRDCEERLGISIDLRIFCYLAIMQKSFAERLKLIIAENTGTSLGVDDQVSILAGLLWTQPAEQRTLSLRSYNPFHSQSWIDSSLVLDLLLTTEIQTLRFEEKDWSDKLNTALAKIGTAYLCCQRKDEDKLHQVLYKILAQPIDVDYLQFFPAIEQVVRNDVTTKITFTLKELV